MPISLRIYSLILLFGSLYCLPVIAYGQTIIDVGIHDVRMHLITPDTGETRIVTTDQLGAYLYDIGPIPRVQFEVLIDSKKHPATVSPKLDLKIERYILLASREASAYKQLPDKKHPDATLGEPTWVYSGPVSLSFNRSIQHDTVRLITEPFDIDFLDPDHPLTFALPADYTLTGFSYRFLLKPSALRSRDSDPSDNAFQLTFLKH